MILLEAEQAKAPSIDLMMDRSTEAYMRQLYWMIA